jgi:small subunit ribosomal protein S18
VGGSRGGPRPYRGPGGGGPRRRARVCQFWATEVKTIDDKDQDMLRQCTSRSGRIQSRRKTGACAKHQRMLSRAIKRARYMALTPYTPHQMQRTIS